MTNAIYTVDYQFIVRVLRAEVSPAEQEFFVQWLNESEKHKSEFAAVSLLWDSMDQAPLPAPPDLDGEWDRLQAKISERGAHRTPGDAVGRPERVGRDHWSRERAPRPAGHTTAAYRTLGIVAASVLLVTVLIVSWVVKNNIDVRTSAGAAEYADIITRNGERVVITLTDGTIVSLNSGSRLTYPRVFADTMRLVKLEGEGYFSVAKNQARPFRIMTGTSVTQVTGTAFNVRFRRDSLVVAVAEGSVTVSQQMAPGAVHLQRGDAAICVGSTLTSYSHVDLEQFMAWRKNKLAFTRAPMRAVMDEIERCFNVDVTFKKESVRQKTLTGVFSTDSLDGILSNIALAMNVRIQRNGKSVIIQ